MSDPAITLDHLDDLVHNAKPMPMTDQVRVDPDEVGRIVDRLRVELPPALDPLAERLEAVVREARSVPLTGQVRIDKDAFYEALDAIREALPR